jgi:hypothetical protein
MTGDGGGWTLVRVDDATDKSPVKSAGAAGTVPSSLSCAGSNVKLSDAVIKRIWTTQMRVTVRADTAGDMVYLSDTNLAPLTSFSDQCGANNKITWYFKRAPSVPSQSGALNNHAEYCGWSFGPCASTSELCWYGPHNGYKVHMNASYAHLTIPANLAALGTEQGCAFGWVR